MDPSPIKQQASAVAAALPEELVEEVLLRFPPDDPASLVRAAVVSKRWCRLICGRGFRGRFREFHGKPLLLGFVCQRERTAQDRLFVSTSSFKPRHHGDRRNLKAVHSCHGRVLLHSKPACADVDTLEDLFVWDPITDKLRKLPRWPLHFHTQSCCQGNATVLCAVLGDGCDHLDCHHGPFMVVLAGIDEHKQTFTCVYSSEADRWSDPIYVGQRHYGFAKGNSVVVGNAVYFRCRILCTGEHAILKYDLLTPEVSSIQIPRDGHLKHIYRHHIVLVAMEDGRLGFAAFKLFTSTKPKLYLWSRENDSPDGDARWAQSRVMDLDTLLKTELSSCTSVVAFADTGASGVIFIRTNDGLFSLDLKSGNSKVLGGSFGYGGVVPYASFCTPALGAVSIEEGPGAGEPSA